MRMPDFNPRGGDYAERIRRLVTTFGRFVCEADVERRFRDGAESIFAGSFEAERRHERELCMWGAALARCALELIADMDESVVGPSVEGAFAMCVPDREGADL